MFTLTSRILAGLVAAMLSLAVAACDPADPAAPDAAGGDDGEATEPADAGEEPTDDAADDDPAGDDEDAPAEDDEPEVVVVAHFGGSFEENMNEAVISSFEEEHGIDVRSELGISTETLAKLRAGGGDAGIDVAYMDWAVAIQAKAEGLLQTLDPAAIPNMAEVYDSGRDPDDAMVSQYFGAVGLSYHTELVDSPPTSWADLADDAHAGQIALADITGTAGYYSLLAAAVTRGGDEQNIDPGFELMSAAAENALTFYDQADQLQSLFERREVALAPFYSDRSAVFARQGLPVAFTYPEEGGVLIRGSASIPVGAPNPEAAALFINHILDAGVQAEFSTLQTLGPTNRNTELPAEVAEQVPYGENVENMIVPDDLAISERIGDWTDRWNREVSG